MRREQVCEGRSAVMSWRKRSPIFICFVGMDGSGKTTQAQSLVQRLKTEGIKASYVHNRLAPTISKPFLLLGRALFFRGKGKFENYKGFKAAGEKVFKKPLLAMSYQYLLLSDYFLQSLLKIKLPLLLGRSVVCDRYIHDTVVELALDLNYTNNQIKSIMGKLSRFLPKPDVMFLADVPEDVAYQRKNDIPSIDFVRERRQAYLGVAKEYGITILDGSEDPMELQSLIQNKVAETLKGQIK